MAGTLPRSCWACWGHRTFIQTRNAVRNVSPGNKPWATERTTWKFAVEYGRTEARWSSRQAPSCGGFGTGREVTTSVLDRRTLHVPTSHRFRVALRLVRFPPALPAQVWPERLPTIRNDVRDDAQAVRGSTILADGQIVTNEALLGPTQELLEPFVAKQILQGDDYFEWCLRWNRLQTYLAKQRSFPPRTIRGWMTRQSSFSQGSVGGFGFRGGGPVWRLYHATSQNHQQEWKIGGYGGGPVDIHNPFVNMTHEAGG